MRLAYFLAQAGVASRRASEKLIEEGLIKVNNQIVTSLPAFIDEENDIISYKNKIIKIQQKLYFLLNKPVGYTCSAKDTYAEKLIFELIDCKERLFTIGRLDRDSEGLIILTNDGPLSQRISHPSYNIEKKYRVTVKNTVSKYQLNKVCQEGIRYEGILYKAKNIQIKRSSKDRMTLNFTLTSGKKREIRKICQALQLTVINLKRYQIGSLKLDKTPTGSYRKLKTSEIEQLLKL